MNSLNNSQPQKKRSWKSKAVLMMLLTLSVTACEMVGSNQVAIKRYLPAWPVAGPAVAAELDRVCPLTKDENGKAVTSCPAIDNWLAKLKKYHEQEGALPDAD